MFVHQLCVIFSLRVALHSLTILVKDDRITQLFKYNLITLMFNPRNGHVRSIGREFLCAKQPEPIRPVADVALFTVLFIHKYRPYSETCCMNEKLTGDATL